MWLELCLKTSQEGYPVSFLAQNKRSIQKEICSIQHTRTFQEWTPYQGNNNIEKYIGKNHLDDSLAGVCMFLISDDGKSNQKN